MSNRISPRELARHGWTRVGSSSGKVNAEWRHREGWTLAHCGHPTALTPWMLKDPSGAFRWRCIASHATAVARSGQHVP